MIKNNESIVNITNRNVKYYNTKGYKCKIGDDISIDINTMAKKSHNRVIAICEICYIESEIEYAKYNKNINNGGFYSCRKCAHVKSEKTCMDKYGVEYFTQTEDFKDKQQKWMSSDEFKRKSKETQIERYDMLYTQTEKSRDNISKKTTEIIKKKKDIGIYECNLSKPDNKEKRLRGMVSKYGYEYSSNIDSIKNKIHCTNLERYGHISPFGNDDIKNKAKNTMIERYGVDNPFKNKEIQDRIQALLKEKYYDIINLEKKEFHIYRNKIRHITSKNRKELFNSWNGYDYYDSEYIKDYITLDKNDNNYPSVDHKISCLYGYLNNISIEVISSMENLCITKRIINTKKRHLTEGEFIEILKK